MIAERAADLITGRPFDPPSSPTRPRRPQRDVPYMVLPMVGPGPDS
jgi:hypothetical protein